MTSPGITLNRRAMLSLGAGAATVSFVAHAKENTMSTNHQLWPAAARLSNPAAHQIMNNYQFNYGDTPVFPFLLFHVTNLA
jgi:hypothetical protein